ncbi:hypothetical protein KY359_00370, partial [Candidatus Woesearchaeota archaeon]|nr:hypothetical protein [Candidatus Woesearchaeota archaeon]
MRPRMKRAGQGKSTPEDNGRNKKAMIVLLLALVFFSLSATVAEAALRDSIRSGWSSIRVYVLSAPFWVNVLILFGVGMVLYTLLLAKSMGSDNSTKAIIYIVLILIAIVIATKFMGDDGKPEYLWRNDQFRNFTRFLIGPKDSLGACPSSHSGWRALAGLNPNPPCCGTGAYWTLAEGERVCKQAILRTNVAGTGLPALIFAFLAFYLLFGAYGGKLGFDRMGSGGGKWFPIFLSLVLAALIANERVPKNH